jgi:phage-related protein
VAQGFASFAGANPGIVKIGVAIAGVVAAIGPLLVAIGSVISVVGGLLPGLMTAIPVIATVISGISFGPILLGVAAISAGIALIATNWDLVRLALSAVKDAFMSAFQGVLPALQSLWQSLVQARATMVSVLVPANQASSAFTMLGGAARVVGSITLGLITILFRLVATCIKVGAAFLQLVATAVAAFTRMVSGAASAVARIGALFNSLRGIILGAIRGVAAAAFSAGANIMGRLADGLRSALGAVRSAAGEAASAVMSVLPNSPVPSGPLTVLNRVATNPGAKIVDMLAGGVSAAAPQLRGAIASASSAGIETTPTSSLGSGGGASNVTMNLSFSFPGVSSQQDAYDISDEFSNRVRQVISDFYNDRTRLSYG